MADESEIQIPHLPDPEVRYLSKSLVSEANVLNGSEYGGVEGLIQPLPHRPTASERLSMIYAIEPTDPGTGLGSVQPPEQQGDFT